MRNKVYSPKRLNKTARAMLKDQRVSVIVDNFHGVDWHQKTKVFPNFCVYENPKDFPDKIVVRLFDGPYPTRLIAVKDTLEEARKSIQTNLFLRVPRSNEDDPTIVETWL